MKKGSFRAIANVVMLAGAFFLPWWLTFLLAIIVLLNVHRYIEIIVLGFILDSLYSIDLEHFFHFEFVLTTAAVILFLISGPIKRRLIFYT